MHKSRLAVFLVIFLFFFILLTGRLACMQIVQREYYEAQVERIRRRVEIFSGPRGTIYDRKGEVLATDRQVFDASFILPLLDPLVVVKPLVCRVVRLSEKEFNKRLEQARLAAAAENRPVQTLVHRASQRAIKRLQYLARKYPEKYGSLVVRENRVNGYTFFSLDVDLEELCRKGKTLRRLTKLLGLPYEEAVEKISGIERKIAGISNSYQRSYELYTPYPLARNISREQVEELEVRYRSYPGIVVSARTQRVHPHGDLACHVLGYLREISGTERYEELKSQDRIIRRGFNELADFEKIKANPFFHDDMIGATGIELVYDSYIQGRKGARLLERDTRSPESTVLSEIPPKPGGDLYLTIDAVVQRAAQEALAEADIVGAAVFMDVNTGEVIALASSPGYDLDSFRQDSETFKKHLEKPYPLLNRALSALAPGSGFKVVTAIAAIEEGAITNHTHFYCRGYYKTPKAFRCWNRGGHGSINLTTAIEGSCNVYFYATGERVGQEKLSKWSRILGFAGETGIDLPGDAQGLIPNPDWKKSRVFASRRKLQRLQLRLAELTRKENSQADDSQPAGGKSLKERAEQLENEITREEKRLALFESEKAWVPGDTRNMAIGQGNVLVSPLQMTRMMAAIANGGRLLRPHLTVQSSEDYLERNLPVSPATLATVRNAMRLVVFGRRGTARQDGLKKYKAAVKTGTAEIGGDLNNGWIIGFAPYSDPQISFAVMAERTKLHGGDVAGPVAAKILDAYFGGNPGKEKE